MVTWGHRPAIKPLVPVDRYTVLSRLPGLPAWLLRAEEALAGHCLAFADPVLFRLLSFHAAGTRIKAEK